MCLDSALKRFEERQTEFNNNNNKSVLKYVWKKKENRFGCVCVYVRFVYVFEWIMTEEKSEWLKKNEWHQVEFAVAATPMLSAKSTNLLACIRVAVLCVFTSRKNSIISVECATIQLDWITLCCLSLSLLNNRIFCRGNPFLSHHNTHTNKHWKNRLSLPQFISSPFNSSAQSFSTRIWNE